MPRVRVTRGRKPGTEKIGKGNVHRESTAPRPPSLTTEYVPDVPQSTETRQGTRPGTRPKTEGRTFKRVPNEPAYMAEGGIIQGIQRGVGEPATKALDFMHGLISAAEYTYWLLGDNDGLKADLNNATKQIDAVRKAARGV